MIMAGFSPLALTQALPFLPLAQGDIDYQVERRSEPNLINRVLAEPSTTVILVRHGKVAVPFGQSNIMYHANVKMRLATLPGLYVAAELKEFPEAVAMYLGSYGGKRDEHVVAVDISALDGGAANARQESSTVDQAFDESGEDMQEDQPSASLLRNAVTRFDWVDLRAFAPHASMREVGQAVTAVCLGGWQESQHFCPACGAPTVPALAGWAQRCTSPDDGRILFPRIEPAVIITVVDSQDRLLLQHNKAWQDPDFYSVSAGFVEAGENLEHACRRETMEETGIKVGEVKYLGSQPWPYRASLMMGFKGRALSTEIHVDNAETVKAMWVTRDEFTNGVIEGRIHVPKKATIARYMIEEWLGRPLD